jgi:hypothetical protein
MKTTTTYAAFVGLDWADRFHQVCLRAADGTRDEQSKLAHDPRALHAWAYELRARFPQGKIAVALEQTKGPLVYALSMHAHLELFPLNPAMLAKYREAVTAASGTKNDPLDASLACEVVRIHGTGCARCRRCRQRCASCRGCSRRAAGWSISARACATSSAPR